MASGTVKWFNGQKGYGFIQPDTGGKDVFVHISAVEKAGLSDLREGAKVTFDIVPNKGKGIGGKSSGEMTESNYPAFRPLMCGVTWRPRHEGRPRFPALSARDGRGAPLSRLRETDDDRRPRGQARPPGFFDLQMSSVCAIRAIRI